MKQHPALKKIVEYISRLIVAMLLMVWGTLNLVTNVLDMTRGESGRSWQLSLPFIIIFALIPICLGVWLLSRLMRTSK